MRQPMVGATEAEETHVCVAYDREGGPSCHLDVAAPAHFSSVRGGCQREVPSPGQARSAHRPPSFPATFPQASDPSYRGLELAEQHWSVRGCRVTARRGEAVA